MLSGPKSTYRKQLRNYYESDPVFAVVGGVVGGAWEPIGWEAPPMRSMPISLLTHPSISGQLYAGLTNGEVWQSSDYGDTWEKLPFNFTGIWRSLIVLESEN